LKGGLSSKKKEKKFIDESLNPRHIFILCHNQE